MTTLTYELTDTWVKLVQCDNDGVELIGVDCVMQATPALILSADTTFKQRTLRGIKQMIAGYEPVLSEENVDNECVAVYNFNDDDELVARYLKVTAVEKDSFWYMVNCVPYKEGVIHIDAVHPLSTLAKAHNDDVVGVKTLDEVVLRTETIDYCDGCGGLHQLQKCGTYDDEGEIGCEVDLCTTCRTNGGYTYTNNDMWFTLDINSALRPHYDWEKSYRFGGVMSYSYKTVDCPMLTPYCFVQDKQDAMDTPWLGAELEVGCTEKRFKERNNYAKEIYKRVPKGMIAICEDGSLRSDGRSFEIITVPAKLNKLKNGLKDIFKDDLVTKEAPDKEYTYGLHVHVDRKALRTMQLSKMVTFMNAKENQGFLIAIAGRPSTSYTSFNDSLRKVSKQHGCGGERSTALNLNNSATVEFRLFNSPHSYDELCLRLEFVEALTVYCRNVAGLNDLGFTRFIDWIRTTAHGYPYLKKFMVDFKYRPIDIPLSTIANTKDSKFARLWANVSELEGISATRPAYSRKLGQTISSINSSGTLRPVVVERVTKAILDYVYQVKCDVTPDKFWSVMTEDVCEHLPDSLYFQYANGKVMFDKHLLNVQPTLTKTINNAIKGTF